MEAVECRVLRVHRLEQLRRQLPERRALRLAVCSRLAARSRLAAYSRLTVCSRLAGRRQALDSALDSGAAPRQPEACSEPGQAVPPLWLSLRTQPCQVQPLQAEMQRTGRRQ